MGFTMAVTQPAGRGFTGVRDEVGRVFSVGLRTADLERTSDLYRTALGMETLLEVSWREGQWHSMFGVPKGEEAALHLLKGAGTGTGLGTIEVQSFPEHLLGPPPATGLISATYQTGDADAARAAAELVGEVVDVTRVSFVLVGDMGQRLEVTQASW